MRTLKFLLKNLTGRLYIKELDRIVVERTGNTIIAGPFTGMRYVDKPNNEGHAAKLVGTYERELLPILERVRRTPYGCILNVGSSEGYYAVGLAMTMPNVRVIAYDIDPEAVRNVNDLAQRNNVADRVQTAGLCDHAELNRYRGERCLVLCDIEGGEDNLLDPRAAQALVGFDILVEIHDGRESTRIRDLLVDRFKVSHALEFIPCQRRKASDCPRSMGIWHPKARLRAVDEDRVKGIEWGYFLAKS